MCAHARHIHRAMRVPTRPFPERLPASPCTAPERVGDAIPHTNSARGTRAMATRSVCTQAGTAAPARTPDVPDALRIVCEIVRADLYGETSYRVRQGMVPSGLPISEMSAGDGTAVGSLSAHTRDDTGNLRV